MRHGPRRGSLRTRLCVVEGVQRLNFHMKRAEFYKQFGLPCCVTTPER